MSVVTELVAKIAAESGITVVEDEMVPETVCPYCLGLDSIHCEVCTKRVSTVELEEL